jgi:hypothetical protein
MKMMLGFFAGLLSGIVEAIAVVVASIPIANNPHVLIWVFFFINISCSLSFAM